MGVLTNAISGSGNSKEVISKAITNPSDIANVTFTAEEWTKLKAGADLVFTYLTITFLTERVMNLLPNPLIQVDSIFYKLHQVNFASDTSAAQEGYMFVVANSDGTAEVSRLVFLSIPIRYTYADIPVSNWYSSTAVSGYGYQLTLTY